MTFQELEVKQSILKALADMGFEQPTPIQEKTIPVALEGRDLIGQAQTGTGKTVAFAIPVVEKVEVKKGIQALVITPTRELCIQVAEEINKIAKYAGIMGLPIYGGQAIDRQMRGLKRNPQIIIATPGRLLDHIERRTIRLNEVSTVVIDEADEMMDMGFLDDIGRILKQVPSERQTMLFSATMPKPILKLVEQFMTSPKLVAMKAQERTAPSIEQRYFETRESDKREALTRLLDAENPDLAVIFCRTKKGVDDLTEVLRERGYAVEGLHGDLSQAKRDQVMGKFRTGKIEYLIATDVAARGIDVENVSHVFNFDIPQDPDSYVHRIGRTGRAGREGKAFTLVTPRETRLLHFIEKSINLKLPKGKLPTSVDVRETKLNRLQEQLEQVLATQLKSYRSKAEELLETHDSVEILSAALKYLAEGENAKTDKPDKPEREFSAGSDNNRGGGRNRRDDGEKIRFYVNIGKKDRFHAKDIVKLITQKGNIPPYTIGDIEMFDKFSFVDVSASVGKDVHKRLSGEKVGRRPLRFEPAQESDKSQK